MKNESAWLAPAVGVRPRAAAVTVGAGMLPDLSPMAYWREYLKLQVRALAHYRRTARWLTLLNSQPLFADLLVQCPRLMHKIYRPYLSRALSPDARIDAIAAHYAFIGQRGLAPLVMAAARDQMLVATIAGKSGDELELRLRAVNPMEREGELVLQLCMAGRPVYSLAFSLSDGAAGPVLNIGCLQGCNSEQGQETIGTPHAWPILADQNGFFPRIYYSGSYAIKVTMTTSGGAVLPGYPIDPAQRVGIGSSAASGVSVIPTVLVPATNVQDALTQIQARISLDGHRNRLHNGNFNINQRAVAGTVTLAAGAYGHDRWKSGAAGATYTFAAAGGVNTMTITAGSLVQVIEGANLQDGTHVLSWVGTAQGRIGGGSFAVSGTTSVVTGGADLNIEFGTGTLSRPQLEVGTTPTSFEFRGSAPNAACACAITSFCRRSACRPTTSPALPLRRPSVMRPNAQ